MFGEQNAGVALLERIQNYVIDPILAVIFALGLLLFFVGIVEYLWEVKDGKADGNGRQHMMWGMAGMLIMVSVYGIVNLIVNTLGIDPNTATDIGRAQQVQTGANFFGR